MASAQKGPSAPPGRKEPSPPFIRLENRMDILYIGLNARGNRHVTFKVASPMDLWFHAHEIPEPM
ncbi:hypothetical protein MASR2M79_14830 [Aminivibrio sp.]